MTQPKARIFRYELPGGWSVLAGASDEDNEYLSISVAKPEDWWFHAQDVPGSHVILRAADGQEPDQRTLELAASLAAYHSKARRAGSVRVLCTRARFVTKRRGTKLGTVHVTGHTILKVRPDISAAKRLPSDNGA